MTLRLLTPRLELIAGTIELAQAEIASPASLARLLEAPTPDAWPPPLNDAQSQQVFLDALQKASPADVGWTLWYCLRRDPRALVGVAGFKGPPQNGVAEIGYSMLEAHQRNGYCTEAVRALLAWAFEHSGVHTIIGHTLPALAPSIRVMEKCGFVFGGSGPLEDGVQAVRYEFTFTGNNKKEGLSS